MHQAHRHPLWLAAVAALLLSACGDDSVEVLPADSVAGAKVGAEAPAFTLTDQTGKQHSLAEYRGKMLVLEWINPNCPFSRRHAEEGTMTKLAKSEPEVVWLGVNSTAASHGDFLAPEEHAAWNAEHQIAYPVLYDSDGKVGQAYGAKTTPHMIVIHEAGNVFYNGAIDDDPNGRNETRTNYVQAALAAHRAGRTAEPAATRPYGCSVKYEG
jgi:peroxiredoxin